MYPMLVEYTELHTSSAEIANSFVCEVFEAKRLYVIPISRREGTYSDQRKVLGSPL